MGVYHFMGLGQAIGAVTCAVDYIEKAIDLSINLIPMMKLSDCLTVVVVLIIMRIIEVRLRQ